MNNPTRPDLESRLRDHYTTMAIGTPRDLVSRTADAIDRAPRRRWSAQFELPRRRVAQLAFGGAVLAVLAIAASTLWFGSSRPAGPAPSSAPSAAVASLGPSVTPGYVQVGPTVLLATRTTALGRMAQDNGAWSIQGTVFEMWGSPGSAVSSSLWPASDLQPPAIFVLNAGSAWTVTLTPGSVLNGQGPPFDHLNVVVNRTQDGHLWQQAAVPGDYTDCQISISFANLTVGYMIASPHDGARSATVLATADGGATWNIVAKVQTPNGSLGAVLSVNDEVATNDDQTLWAGGQAEAKTNHPLLAVSRDGGKTWSEVTLPGLEGVWAGDGAATIDEPPVFFNSSVGFVATTGNPPEVL